MNELLKALLGNIDGGIEEVKDEKVFDLKTKEGHDEAVKSLNEVLKMLDKNPIFDLFLSKDLVNSLIGCVDKIYENSADEEEDKIVQPSTLLNEAELEKVNALVDEYVDTIIQPLGNFEDNTLKLGKASMSNQQLKRISLMFATDLKNFAETFGNSHNFTAKEVYSHLQNNR